MNLFRIKDCGLDIYIKFTVKKFNILLKRKVQNFYQELPSTLDLVKSLLLVMRMKK